MAIADTISSMYENVGEVYDTITNVDLPTNKNIQNIPSTMRSSYLEIMNNGIDKIWNNWEKVTGEGETLTLNSTEEAPMKINLKGNTSQETTTGKNLFAGGDTTTTNGITFTKHSDGSYDIVGTATSPAYILNYVPLAESGIVNGETYTISSNQNLTGLEIRIESYNGNTWLRATLGGLITFPKTHSADVTGATSVRFGLFVNSGTTINLKNLKIQLEKGSSVTSFEPYTNGASPNPDYPQDVHVVSGDNTIKVEGKNLYYTDSQTKTFTSSAGNWKYLDGAAGADYSNPDNTLYKAYVENGKTYTFTCSITASASISSALMYYDNTTIQAASGTDLTYNKTFTARKTGYIIMRYYVNNGITVSISNVQLELGSTATTYEPYQSASYPISLGVENLLQNNLTSGTNNGITYVVNEDKSVTLNGTATAITWLILNSSVTLEAGTYTVTSGYSDNDVRVYSTGLGVYTLNGQRTVTKTSSVSGDVAINIPSGTICNNLTIKPMIEKGSKANSYTPYGTTQIELCKIGDYQDSIKKSTGKNLWHFTSEALYSVNTVTPTIINENTLQLVSGNNTYANALYLLNLPNGTYTFKLGKVENTNSNMTMKRMSLVQIINGSTSLIQHIDEGNSYTVTINNEEGKPYGIRFWATYATAMINTATFSDIQIEKGTTSTPYEPYGKVWYLNKQIGKVAFDGSENWSINTSYTYNVFYRTLDNYARISNAQTTYCEYYKGIENTAGIVDFGNNYNNSIGVRTANDNIKDIYISNNSITSASDFKTWLSTHNTIVYYVLATPTTTEITDSTLLSQLDTIKRSYDEQTNITQVNNDLPFILDVTALKELTQ